MEKTLEANPTKHLSLRVLKELWVAIIEKVYDFEHDWLKVKRFEVGLSVPSSVMDARHLRLLQTLCVYDDMIEALRPGPNKRRPSEVEGYSDGRDSPPPTKKVLRGCLSSERRPQMLIMIGQSIYWSYPTSARSK